MKHLLMAALICCLGFSAQAQENERTVYASARIIEGYFKNTSKIIFVDENGQAEITALTSLGKLSGGLVAPSDKFEENQKIINQFFLRLTECL